MGRPQGNQPSCSTGQCQALWGHEPSQGILPTFLGKLQPVPFTDEDAQRGRCLYKVTQQEVASLGLTPSQIEPGAISRGQAATTKNSASRLGSA